MSALIDYTGATFGRLTVISRAGSRGSHATWKCKCVCGGEIITTGTLLRKGETKSCGCLRSETTSKLKYRGGRVSHPLYLVYVAIKQRCNNPKNSSYPRYGGRGIYLSKEWDESFEAFAADMGERPSAKHSIERRDNNGPYCKANCYWATATQQASNKRNTRFVEYKGISKPLFIWCQELGLSYNRVFGRLRYGWTSEDAFETPICSGGVRKPLKGAAQ